MRGLRYLMLVILLSVGPELHGQGLVRFNNLTLPPVNSFAPGDFLPSFGNCTGPLLEGPVYQAELLAGATPQLLTPIAPATPFLTGVNAGFFDGGLITVPVAPGATVYIGIRFWDSQFGSTYEEAFVRQYQQSPDTYATGSYTWFNPVTFESGNSVPVIAGGAESAGTITGLNQWEWQRPDRGLLPTVLRGTPEVVGSGPYVDETSTYVSTLCGFSNIGVIQASAFEVEQSGTMLFQNTGQVPLVMMMTVDLIFLTPLACSTTDLRFLAQPGVTYYLLFASQNRATGSIQITASLKSTLIARYIFYNQSKFDGNDASANTADDGAIAPNKSALLPGQTATFAHYTSYRHGINGVMMDIDGLPGTPSVSDFEFRVGNNSTPSGWATATAPSSITVRAGEGVAGSSRVTLIWPNEAVKKTWLQVRVKATADTGLAADDVFYFGNAVGESGDTSAHARVEPQDELRARINPRGVFTPATIDFPYDFNRDGNVDATDQLLARINGTSVFTELKLITPP